MSTFLRKSPGHSGTRVATPCRNISRDQLTTTKQRRRALRKADSLYNRTSSIKTLIIYDVLCRVSLRMSFFIYRGCVSTNFSSNTLPGKVDAGKRQPVSHAYAAVDPYTIFPKSYFPQTQSLVSVTTLKQLMRMLRPWIEPREQTLIKTNRDNQRTRSAIKPQHEIGIFTLTEESCLPSSLQAEFCHA